MKKAKVTEEVPGAGAPVVVEEKKEEPVMKEIGVTSGVIWKVLQPFFIRICNGPAVNAPVDSKVMLQPGVAMALFDLGKIVPHCPGIPESGEYIATRKINTVLAGEFVELEAGSRIELPRDEAIELLRQFRVVPVDERFFNPNEIAIVRGEK